MIQTITANGTFTLAPTTNITNIYVSGDLGTATAFFAYKNAALVPLPLSGRKFIVGQQYRIEHGIDVEIFIVVTGANGATSIEVESVPA